MTPSNYDHTEQHCSNNQGLEKKVISSLRDVWYSWYVEQRFKTKAHDSTNTTIEFHCRSPMLSLSDFLSFLKLTEMEDCIVLVWYLNYPNYTMLDETMSSLFNVFEQRCGMIVLSEGGSSEKALAPSDRRRPGLATGFFRSKPGRRVVVGRSSAPTTSRHRRNSVLHIQEDTLARKGP